MVSARAGRRAGIVLALPIAILALAWIAAPALGRLALARGMRDLRRNEGLDGKYGALVRAGAGFELDDLDIRTPDDAPVLSVRAIRASPAVAWPPVVLDVTGARVTQRGLDAWAKSFAGANASWYRKTAQTIRRDYPALAERAARVRLHDVVIERDAGSLALREGVLTLRIPRTTRLELTFDGGIAVDAEKEAACGPPSQTFAATSTSVDVFQDSLAIRLTGDVASLSPACRDCLYGHLDATRRVPAPGWTAVTTTAASFSGPKPLGCILGW